MLPKITNLVGADDVIGLRSVADVPFASFGFAGTNAEAGRVDGLETKEMFNLPLRKELWR